MLIVKKALLNSKCKTKFPYTFLRKMYHLYWLKTSYIKVSPSHCITFTGFSYAKNGWHPLIELLKEIDDNSNISFKESSLYTFHKKYCPEGIYELVRHKNEGLQFRPAIGIFPWGAFEIGSGLNGFLEGVDWNRSRFCGPTRDDLIEAEFRNYIHLYKSIKFHGYKPWKHGFIQGTLLKRCDGNFRFIPLQGNHRTAILSYLNYDSILVSSRRDSYDVIYEENVDKWHYVKTGQCSRKDALAYFNAFFELTGFEQAQRFGLIAIE